MCMAVAAVMHKSLSVIAPDFSAVLQRLSRISDAVDVVVPGCITAHPTAQRVGGPAHHTALGE